MSSGACPVCYIAELGPHLPVNIDHPNIGPRISVMDLKGNLLAAGTHVFTATVTDQTSGCTSVEGPFTVTINALPTVQIASSPSGFLCENDAATLNVVSPQPALNYFWNTGETGASINVVAGVLQ